MLVDVFSNCTVNLRRALENETMSSIRKVDQCRLRYECFEAVGVVWRDEYILTGSED